jgi:hypothetical protein
MELLRRLKGRATNLYAGGESRWPLRQSHQPTAVESIHEIQQVGLHISCVVWFVPRGTDQLLL